MEHWLKMSAAFMQTSWYSFDLDMANELEEHTIWLSSQSRKRVIETENG